MPYITFSTYYQKELYLTLLESYEILLTLQTSGNTQPDTVTPHLSMSSYLILDWQLNSSVYLDKQYYLLHYCPFFIPVHKSYQLCSKFQSCFCYCKQCTVLYLPESYLHWKELTFILLCTIHIKHYHETKLTVCVHVCMDVCTYDHFLHNTVYTLPHHFKILLGLNLRTGLQTYSRIATLSEKSSL
jgi:hypothetical protein